MSSTMSATWMWYASRGSGLVSLMLFSAVMVLGLLTAGSRAPLRGPRFVVTGLHRSVSLLAVAFLAVHVATVVLDDYVTVGWLDAVVPFISSYQPLWVGLGVVASDITLALVVTSLLRARLGHRTWRAVHWLAYASWPIALVHGLGGGTDGTSALGLGLTAACVAAVGATAAMRFTRRSASANPALVHAVQAPAFAHAPAAVVPVPGNASRH